MRSRLLRLVAIALLLGLPPALRAEPALACVCGEALSPAEELQEAAAVFAGTLVDVTDHEDGDGWLFLLFEFDVIQVWKGNPGPTMAVKAYLTSCLPHRELGEDHLVYAYAVPGEEYLSLGGACGNTGLLAYYTQDDLAALGPGQAPAPDSLSDADSPPSWATGLLAGLVAALGGVLVTLTVIALRGRARQA